jgi:NAD(P)-dependent dehydrogenase (short-subunit alcohol dehydrogenase family)
LSVPAFETYAYSASKAALHHMTRVLAVRLGSQHITVNAIAAGPFESKMMKATLEKFKVHYSVGLCIVRSSKSECEVARCRK